MIRATAVRSMVCLVALSLAATLTAACRSQTQWVSDEGRQLQAQRDQYGPCTPTRRVPVYETVMEPVYEKRTTPVYKEYEVPVYKYVEEPIYTTRYEPIEGFKTRPVMVRRKQPVTIEYQGKCGPAEQTLYCVDKCVQTGVERVPATLGHRAVREQWGVKRVPVIVGYEMKRERNGCKTECVKVGEKPVDRICGWKVVPVGQANAAGQVRAPQAPAAVGPAQVGPVPVTDYADPAPVSGFTDAAPAAVRAAPVANGQLAPPVIRR